LLVEEGDKVQCFNMQVTQKNGKKMILQKNMGNGSLSEGHGTLGKLPAVQWKLP